MSADDTEVKNIKNLNDKVLLKAGQDCVKGRIIHVGIDSGGPIYLVEYATVEGLILERWTRPADLIDLDGPHETF